MNKPVLIAIIVAVLALGGAFFASRRASAPEIEEVNNLKTLEGVSGSGESALGMPVPDGTGVAETEVVPAPENTPAKAPVAEAPKVKTYTMAEVSTRNSASSCWTVVNGDVYDVTSYIKKHPGGEKAVLGLCGKDGTSAFEGQHGGQAKPANVLAGFEIGVLAK